VAVAKVCRIGICTIQWENSVKSNEKIRNKEKCLISHQTRQDIISAILGFKELCTYKLKKSNATEHLCT
jgi:hypothetical protein